jgi:K+-transporting ATPase KdpF subunit
MSVVLFIATLIAVALTGYLCVALLKPEWFE